MSSNSVMSLYEWLESEYDVYPDDWKHYDKRTKNDMKKEYERYVAEAP